MKEQDHQVEQEQAFPQEVLQVKKEEQVVVHQEVLLEERNLGAN